MKFLIIATVAAVGFVLPSKAAPEGRRICRIIFPERENGPQRAYLFDGRGSREVPLPSMNFSEVISLPAGDLNVAMTPSPVSDPELMPPGAPRLTIPSNARDFYILVTHDPSNSTLPVKMNLVIAEGGKLKPGETLWFNLTEHRVAAKLGASKMLVDPHNTAVSQGPISQSGYYRAEFAFQEKGAGSLQRMTEQQWWHDVESRHLGFILNTGGKLPKIFFYRDFRILGEKIEVGSE